ncbi:hypothetical protein LY474_36010 [Myxococcus stipitatus]|uniref:hypothetical protein n=1 Tax=Myxococcus stipitatus TaxID=83455 RepID=UPI001F49094E|nr:hypothetical protein [Myxococcus stipitatus]MCE9673227.1 hypothetical protein [Myxococcus stipitatus]
MKRVSVKGGLLCAVLMLTACGGVDTGVELEQPLPDETIRQESELANCIFYVCPATGKRYGGTTDYAARHLCELRCGDFCTFDGNDCA